MNIRSMGEIIKRIPRWDLGKNNLGQGVLALLVTLVLALIPLDSMEGVLYDFRVRIKPAPPLSPLIENIYIEPETVNSFKGLPQLRDHLAFLQYLKDENARAIVYLINPAEIEGSPAERKKLADLIGQLRDFIYVTDEMVMRGEQHRLVLSEPFRNVRVMSGPVTSDLKHFSQDSVTRRMMLSYQGQELFPLPLVREVRPRGLKMKDIRGRFSFYDSEQIYIDMAKPNTFPATSFQSVVDHKVKVGRYLNKIIFVGLKLGKSSREFVRTPHSRAVTAMTLVELHANMFNALLLNSAPIKLPRFISILLMFILVTLSVMVVLNVKPLKGLLLIGLTFLGVTLIAFVAFWPFGYWVDLAHPWLGVLVTYYLMIPYRLIMENRKTWELAEKNRILVEVEELKTNFMGMMSHDLKTPLARIQGMIEIIQRDKNPLSEDQKVASHSIQKSTEDLLKFISSILNFSRIESEGIKLHLKSKDLNSVLEEVIAQSEFLAKEKGIRLVKMLEPLFSIKIDPELIKQVITNLLENAIKYSPARSTITLKTEEKNERVFLHVIDEGVGIPADEMAHLFVKFYRSRRAKNSGVNGSGLGLYLSRYFVELHGGQLTVMSEEDKGSTFTMELPLEMKNI